VAAGQDESTIVQLDEAAEPLCARLGAEHYEDGAAGTCSRWPVRTSSSVEGCRRGLAVAVGNSGAEPDFDVGVAFS
jgi:hypothetical protein